MEDQLLRSLIADVAVLQQLSPVRLDADQLRTQRHQTPVLQGLQTQPPASVPLPLLFSLLANPADS